MKATWLVFSSTFLIALLVHGALWSNINFIDDSLWISHTEHISNFDQHIFDKGIYGHPGTSLVVTTIG